MKIKLPAGIVLVVLLAIGCAGSGALVSPAGTLSPGVIESGVYTSEYAGVEFAAPAGWEFAGDDQLALAMGMEGEAPVNHRFPENAADQAVFYDMFAQDMYTGESALVMYENLKGTENADITVPKYLEQVKEMIGSQNLGYVLSDAPDCRIGNSVYRTVRCEMTDQGAVQYYFVRRVGDAMLSITVTAGSEENAVNILTCFS
jgi:hypothetical protein